MIRKRLYRALALLIVGLMGWWWATAPLPSSTLSTPTVTIVMTEPADGTPEPAMLRGFDSAAQVGLGLLDGRAEVLFDAAP